MPLYSYRCTTCHAPHEVRAEVDRRDRQQCPDCGKRLVRNYASPHVAAIAGIPNRIGAEIEAGPSRYA